MQYLSKSEQETFDIAKKYAETLSRGDVILLYGDLIYHYDCYRLCCGEEAEALGLTDYFYGDKICLIEWAENIADVLPEKVKTVRIEKTENPQERIIEL